MSSTSITTSTAITTALSSNATVKDEEPHTFTLFPKLPLELRNMVWTDACFHERLIDIWVLPVPGSGMWNYSAEFYEEQEFTYKSHCRRAPSILHTSQEARITGLKRYSLEFETRKPIYSDGSARAQMYVNWECDIICPMTKNAYGHEIYQEDLLKTLRPSDWFPKLHRIAFVVEAFRVHHWQGFVSGSRSIKEVILHPKNSALRYLNDDRDFRASRKLDVKLIDFDEDLNETAYGSSGHIHESEYTLRIREEIRFSF